MMTKKIVHFGPVWKNNPSISMVLCVSEKENEYKSRTMTRNATVTCPNCLVLMNEKNQEILETAKRIKND